MKARTMVYLDSDQMRALKAWARSEGISLAELMRRIVKQELEGRRTLPPVPAQTYARLVALGSSGRSDVSDRHDAHLADVVQRDHAR
jgi:hypothetical protein